MKKRVVIVERKTNNEDKDGEFCLMGFCYTFEEALEKLKKYREIDNDKYLYRLTEMNCLVND